MGTYRGGRGKIEGTLVVEPTVEVQGPVVIHSGIIWEK